MQHVWVIGSMRLNECNSWLAGLVIFPIMRATSGRSNFTAVKRLMKPIKHMWYCESKQRPVTAWVIYDFLQLTIKNKITYILRLGLLDNKLSNEVLNWLLELFV